jgi:hypothetical protein
MEDEVGSKTLSSMNPGALPEWPIGEQANIFALIGEKAAAMGMRLIKNMSIRPQKSIRIDTLSEDKTEDEQNLMVD